MVLNNFLLSIDYNVSSRLMNLLSLVCFLRFWGNGGKVEHAIGVWNWSFCTSFHLPIELSIWFSSFSCWKGTIALLSFVFGVFVSHFGTLSSASIQKQRLSHETSSYQDKRHA